MTQREHFTIRLDPGQLARLDALAARIPGGTRSALLRDALERGIRQLEKEYPAKGRRK